MTEDRFNKWEKDFNEAPAKTSLKWVAWIVGFLILAGAIVGVASWVSGWGSQPARIFGVDNVRKTWRDAYEKDRKLTAQAKIVCRTAQQTVANPGAFPPGTLLAYEQTYDNLAADYDALISNKLEGGLVLPPDVARHAPTMEEKLHQIGCSASGVNTINR